MTLGIARKYWQSWLLVRSRAMMRASPNFVLDTDSAHWLGWDYKLGLFTHRPGLEFLRQMWLHMKELPAFRMDELGGVIWFIA